MDYSQLSFKSIIFFIILFGLIIYAYIYYDSLFLYYPFLNIIKVLTVLLAILSITFPHVMDYFKYNDFEKSSYNLEDVLKYHHSNIKY
jgi:hypothetical protein